MENIEHGLLRLAFQVKEQVPAGNEIEMGKGGIFQHIVRRKEDQFANFLFDPITSLIAKEKPAQSFLRGISFDGHRINSSTSVLHRLVVDVGRKNLNRRWRGEPPSLFAEQHRD